MALYTIKHTCGHEIDQQIYGPDTRGQRQFKANRLADQPCSDCQAAARAAGQAAQNRLSAAESAELPTLTGSERQIAWATTIRLGFMEQIQEWAAERTATARSHGSTDEQIETFAGQVATTSAWMLGQTSASWWIDRRTDTIGTLVRQALGVTA